jgi:hypothetical protein
VAGVHGGDVMAREVKSWIGVPEACSQCGGYNPGRRHLHWYWPFRWIRQVRNMATGQHAWPWEGKI